MVLFHLASLSDSVRRLKMSDFWADGCPYSDGASTVLFSKNHDGPALMTAGS